MTDGNVDQIVDAAREFAAEAKVFANGCSEMVRAAYQAGGITIPTSFDANKILTSYPCPSTAQPGDIAGWIANPNGHVCICLGPNSFSTCPGNGQATKLNQNMGHPLTFVRPTYRP